MSIHISNFPLKASFTVQGGDAWTDDHDGAGRGAWTIRAVVTPTETIRGFPNIGGGEPGFAEVFFDVHANCWLDRAGDIKECDIEDIGASDLADPTEEYREVVRAIERHIDSDDEFSDVIVEIGEAFREAFREDVGRQSIGSLLDEVEGAAEVPQAA